MTEEEFNNLEEDLKDRLEEAYDILDDIRVSIENAMQSSEEEIPQSLMDIYAFSTFQKLKKFLTDKAEDFLLLPENIQELIESSTYSNDIANFVYEQVEIDKY